jgi:hypothetical protein
MLYRSATKEKAGLNIVVSLLFASSKDDKTDFTIYQPNSNSSAGR